MGSIYTLETGVKNITTQLYIGDKVFNAISEIIVMETKNRPAEITIVLPRYYNKQTGERLKIDVDIKEGDVISYKRGYNGNNKLRFYGYVSDISFDNNSTYTIIGYDVLETLLSEPINKAMFKKVSNKEIIQNIFPTLTVDFRTSIKQHDAVTGKVSKRMLMGYLSKQGNFHFYIDPEKPDTLIIDEKWHRNKTENKQITRQHIVEGTVNFSDIKPKKVLVRFYLVYSDRTKQSEIIEEGDADGELREKTLQDTNRADAEEEIQALYKELTRTELEGSFTMWAEPFLQHSELIDLEVNKDNFVSNIEVDSIEETLTTGIRQRIILRTAGEE
jgi:hypothetical protein